VSISTTNGLERINEDFKYQYLARKNNSFLSSMLGGLVEDFSPGKFQE